MKQISFVLAVGVVCLRVPLAAETGTATVDPVKTHVTWSLDGSVHTTHGTFRLREGKILLNFEKNRMTGQLVIDAKSGESGNSTRDRRMHAEVLESEKYPEIRFTPMSWQGDITPTGSSKVQVSGIIDVHGASHEVTIPIELKIEHGQFSATGQFDVPYVQWGMKDPSSFLLKVEKKVVIRVTAEGEFAEAR